MTKRRTIGIFGGTFDPIHIGHLRIALELKYFLGLDEVRLLPCHIPPHRDCPVAKSIDRLAMTRLAVESCDEIIIDDREFQRSTASFTVETLQELRLELGEDVSLCLLVGMDSLVSLPQWFRFQDLFDLAHIVVAARPGWHEPDQGVVAQLLRNRRGTVPDLHQLPTGLILVQTLSLLPVSSTDIRNQIKDGQNPQFLLPDSVWEYIRVHKLYT